MTDDPVFHELNAREIRALYDGDLQRQFPEDEVRPWESIEPLLQRGCYRACALERDGVIVSYAFFAKAGRSVLVDYLATPDPWKNRGYGSLLLKRLRSLLTEADRFFIESEDPDVLSGDAAVMARRRLAFYERNGFAQTSVRVLLFHVEYRILSSESGDRRDVNARSGIEELYTMIIPAKWRERILRFHD